MWMSGAQHVLCHNKGVNSINVAYLYSNSRKCHCWKVVVALKVVEVNWFPIIYILANLITNSIHAWLTKDSRWSGVRLLGHARIVTVLWYMILIIYKCHVILYTCHGHYKHYPSESHIHVLWILLSNNKLLLY